MGDLLEIGVDFVEVEIVLALKMLDDEADCAIDEKVNLHFAVWLRLITHSEFKILSNFASEVFHKVISILR